MRIRRTWSIRAKIVALFVVPLLALVVLWGLAVTVTLPPAAELLAASTSNDNVGKPGNALVAALQSERRATEIYLGGGRRDLAALPTLRTSTDRAIADFRRLAGGSAIRGSAGRLANQRIDEAFAALDAISRQRTAVDRGGLERIDALHVYRDLIEAVFNIYPTLEGAVSIELTRETQGLIVLGQAREVLSQEDAMVAGVGAAHRLGPHDYAELAGLINTQRFVFVQALDLLTAADRDAYRRLSQASALVNLRQLEDRALDSARTGAALPFQPTTWQAGYTAAADALTAYELNISASLVTSTRPAATNIILRVVGATLIGLIAVLVTLLASIRLGRQLIRRLNELRVNALQLAEHRLPGVVARLRRGDQVDVDAEAPPLPFVDDEIGVVARAFTTVQRSAIQSAVDEANVRNGVNEVFLNIARRSQTLLHRQISILDRMERRAGDPEELEDLFRVDHLATRMRRHAEDLVILAGALPGRGWRNPVPLLDVIRGAVSEVEDYARVSIRPVPDLSLNGRAVADVIHLLAELIENATSFSPPTTRVQIEGSLAHHGFAVEIEDRGLGMSAAALARANRRLAQPPEFNPADAAQLGLFVVARLAARHGIQVNLRPSPYGGVTAIVLIPVDLVIGELEAYSPNNGRYAISGDSVLASAMDARRSGLLREYGNPPRQAIGAGPADSAPHPGIAAPYLGPAPQSGPAESGPAPQSGPAGPWAVGPAGSGLVADPAPIAVEGVEVPAARTPRHARPEAAEVTALTPDGLPRRVRSAAEPGFGPGHQPMDDLIRADAPIRPADETRTMMAALQRGTAQGRKEAEVVYDQADKDHEAPTAVRATDIAEASGATQKPGPAQEPGAGPAAGFAEVTGAEQAPPERVEAAPAKRTRRVAPATSTEAGAGNRTDGGKDA
jgi:signal transduction histidine kinase